jgi:hypothetical protein
MALSRINRHIHPVDHANTKSANESLLVVMESRRDRCGTARDKSERRLMLLLLLAASERERTAEAFKSLMRTHLAPARNTTCAYQRT